MAVQPTSCSDTVTVLGDKETRDAGGNANNPVPYDPTLAPPKFENPGSEHNSNFQTTPGGHGNVARTGRVIERLGLELDRSKREIALLSAKLEEEQRRSEYSKLFTENLKASALQYEAMYDQAQRTIARKDRKLEDTKTELEAEKSKRARVEQEGREFADSLTKMLQQSQREIARELECAQHATVQYESLKNAIRSKEQSFQLQLRGLRHDMQILEQQRQVDCQTVQRLESISRELREKCKNMDAAHHKVIARYQGYKSERDQSMQSLLDRGYEVDEKAQKLIKELEETLGRMHYVINVKETLLG